MSTIDFVSLKSAIVGLSQDGYLIYWNTCQQIINKEQLKYFPYLANQFKYKITTHQPICLLKASTSLFVCTDRDIKKIQIIDLQSYVRKYKYQQSKHQLPFKIFRQENGIQTAILINSNKQSDSMIDESDENENQNQNGKELQDYCTDKSYIIYSNKIGKILCVHMNFQNMFTLCDISNNQLNHNLGWHQSAMSLVPYRQNSLMLVGTSAGRVIIVSLVGKKMVQDITSSNNLKLGPVNSIVMGIGNHKFYSLHDNGVVEWSMQLQKCLGYYSYTDPYSVLLTQKMCKDSQRLLIGGGTKYIQSIDVNNPKQRTQYETSLQSVHCMKQINGKILCGGSNSMIQVIETGVTNFILFKEQEMPMF